METGIDKEKLRHYQALIERHLRHPKKYRVTVVAALLLFGLLGVYRPSLQRIDAARQRLDESQQRRDTIEQVEDLRTQRWRYLGRIDADMDTNQWIQFLLDGLEGYAVKLRTMESRPPCKVGPYLAVCLAMELEGDYPQLKATLEWLEQSERLIRVDMVHMEKCHDYLLMKLHVLGLMPKANPKKTHA